MIRLAVFTDDLTGALDTGVQFSARGVSTQLVLPGQAPPQCEVLVMNLNTRHMRAEEAFLAVRRAARDMRAQQVPHVYIKTDSGLRGNIGASLAAAMEAWESPGALFVPAYPRLGRTTLGGTHRIDGVPVSQSVFGRDLLNPVRHDEVALLLREQTTRPVQAIARGALPEDGPREGISVADAVTEADMAHIASVVRRWRAWPVMAGCAGFARYLPDILGLQQGPPTQRAYGPPYLVVSGSTSDVSLAQIRRKEALAHVYRDILRDEQSQCVHACSERLLRMLDEAGMAILTPAVRAEDVQQLSEAAKAMGYTVAQAGQRIVAQLSGVVSAILAGGFSGTLVVFGGDTLLHIVSHSKAKGIRPLTEIEPGVVLGDLVLPDRRLTIITKSGSFGSEALLEKLCGAGDASHEGAR